MTMTEFPWLLAGLATQDGKAIDLRPTNGLIHLIRPPVNRTLRVQVRGSVELRVENDDSTLPFEIVGRGGTLQLRGFSPFLTVATGLPERLRLLSDFPTWISLPNGLLVGAAGTQPGLEVEDTAGGSLPRLTSASASIHTIRGEGDLILDSRSVSSTLNLRIAGDLKVDGSALIADEIVVSGSLSAPGLECRRLEVSRDLNVNGAVEARLGARLGSGQVGSWDSGQIEWSSAGNLELRHGSPSIVVPRPREESLGSFGPEHGLDQFGPLEVPDNQPELRLSSGEVQVQANQRVSIVLLGSNPTDTPTVALRMSYRSTAEVRSALGGRISLAPLGPLTTCIVRGAGSSIEFSAQHRPISCHRILDLTQGSRLAGKVLEVGLYSEGTVLLQDFTCTRLTSLDSSGLPPSADWPKSAIAMDSEVETVLSANIGERSVVKSFRGCLRLTGLHGRIAAGPPRKVPKGWHHLGRRQNRTAAYLLEVGLSGKRQPGSINGFDLTALPYEQLEDLEVTRRCDPAERPLIAYASVSRERQRSDAFQITDRLSWILELGRRVQDRGASGASRSAISWTAHRLEHRSARILSVERPLRSLHRMVGYGVRPIPALLTFLLLVTGLTLGGNLAGHDACKHEVEEHYDDVTTRSDRAVSAFCVANDRPWWTDVGDFGTAWISVAVVPAALARVSVTGSPYPYLQQPWDYLAAFGLGLTFLFLVLALRAYLRVDPFGRDPT